MKRVFYRLIALLAFCIPFTPLVNAAYDVQNDFTKTSFRFSVCMLLTGKKCESTPQDNIKFFLEKISTLLLTLITVFAVLFIVIGGIMWSLSGFSPDFISKGKFIIKTNLQAIVIATLSYFIVNLVLWVLGY